LCLQQEIRLPLPIPPLRESRGEVVRPAICRGPPNAEGRLFTSQTRDPGGAVVSSTTDAYDLAGHLVRSTDGAGHVTVTAYDADGHVTTVTTGYGTAAAATTSTRYDAAGNAVAVTDPDGNTTAFRYDADGHVVLTTDPLGHSTTRTYDPAGNLVQQVDRDGRKQTWSYDADGRVLTNTWYAADGITVVNTRAFTYDRDGNLLTATDASGTYQMAYDGDRLVTQTDPNGLTLAYGYDAAGNIVSETDSLGGTVTSLYDAEGNLTRRTFSSPGGPQLRLDLTYDQDASCLPRRATTTSDSAEASPRHLHKHRLRPGLRLELGWPRRIPLERRGTGGQAARRQLVDPATGLVLEHQVDLLRVGRGVQLERPFGHDIARVLEAHLVAREGVNELLAFLGRSLLPFLFQVGHPPLALNRLGVARRLVVCPEHRGRAEGHGTGDEQETHHRHAMLPPSPNRDEANRRRLPMRARAIDHGTCAA
jgi:YD repeat-containing protein